MIPKDFFTLAVRQHFLAQDALQSVPDSFLKNLVVTLAALIIVGAAFFAILGYFKKPDQLRLGRVDLNDDPPLNVRKAPKRYNHDASELRFQALEQRMEAQEKRLEHIEVSRVETLKHINTRFTRVLMALSAITEKLKIHMPTEDESE